MIELLLLIEPWMFFVCGLIILAIGVILGEITVLPWISLAVFSVGIADFFALSAINQIIVFSVVLFLSIYMSHKFISVKGENGSIAESVDDLVNQTIIVSKLEGSDSKIGQGLSNSGKSWNVEHVEGESLALGKKYICTAINGITLLIK
mgnify:CR=1 FL=1